MRNLFLAAGVAALAIAAPAAAERGGKGGGNGGGQAAKVERGGGGGARAQRGGGGEQARAMKVERRGGGQQARAVKAERRGGGEMRVAGMRAERGNKAQRAETRGRDKQVRSENRRGSERVVQRGRDRSERQLIKGRDRNEQRIVQHGRDRDRDLRVRDVRGDDRLALRGRDRDRNIVQWLEWDEDDRWVRGNAKGLANGCPPGLWDKNPLCMPPGQYKKVAPLGAVLPAAFASNVLPLELRDLYPDSDDYYYRLGNGYLYRVDRETSIVRALLPLFGAGLGIGQPFPYAFNSQNYMVPSHYQPFYMDTDDDYYRYSNGYVYEIDRQTGLIEDVIPLYNNGYGVGQMLPASYSYYNLPLQYRSRYVDNDDYFYRYAPGAIYQVDRNTQLITAIASLLTGTNPASAFAIGQPLPMGYSAYNVPYAYRSQYYDTPDAWYRYNNGYIYQVDPTTRLISAIVQAIV